MKCSKCDREAIYFAPYFGKAFCRKHFEELLLERLRRNNRRFELIKPGSSFKPVGPFKRAGELLLKRLVKNWPVKVGKGKEVPVEGSEKIVAEVIRGMIKEELRKIRKEELFFYNFLSKELSLLSKEKAECDELAKELARLEGIAPGYLFAFLETWLKIQELFD